MYNENRISSQNSKSFDSIEQYLSFLRSSNCLWPRHLRFVGDYLSHNVAETGEQWNCSRGLGAHNSYHCCENNMQRICSKELQYLCTKRIRSWRNTIMNKEVRVFFGLFRMVGFKCYPSPSSQQKLKKYRQDLFMIIT